MYALILKYFEISISRFICVYVCGHSCMETIIVEDYDIHIYFYMNWFVSCGDDKDETQIIIIMIALNAHKWLMHILLAYSLVVYAP